MRIRASEQDQIRWLASRAWGGGAFLGGRQRFQREELSLEKKEQNNIIEILATGEVLALHNRDQLHADFDLKPNLKEMGGGLACL